MTKALTLSPKCDSFLSLSSLSWELRNFLLVFLNSYILGFQNLFPCQASDLVVKDSENEAVVWISWVGWVGHLLINLTRNWSNLFPQDSGEGWTRRVPALASLQRHSECTYQSASGSQTWHFSFWNTEKVKLHKTWSPGDLWIESIFQLNFSSEALSEGTPPLPSLKRLFNTVYPWVILSWGGTVGGPMGISKA